MLKFEKKEHYERFIREDMDLSRARSKLSMEIVDFRNVLSVYPSFRGDFISKN
jgi:hypothetical protein